jgi:hypothetical protein
MTKLVENVDYMLYYPPSKSSYGLLMGNYNKIPEDWVPAGDKIVSLHTCERKTVFCPSNLVDRVKEEVIEPSRKAARNYVMPY